MEDKKKLINGLWTCDKALEIKDNVASYSAIKDFLNLSEDVLFNFETKKIYKYKGKDKDGKNEYEEIYKPLVRDGLKCSETNNLIYKYINNFNDFSDSDKYDIIEILTDYSKFADERVNLLQKYGIKLDRIQVNKLLKDLKRGYCNLSKEILLKILPIMENENKTYDKAFKVLTYIILKRNIKNLVIKFLTILMFIQNISLNISVKITELQIQPFILH